jgi:two-component system, sensor histidine kinase and response regulator
MAASVVSLFAPVLARGGASAAVPVLVASHGQREKLPEEVLNWYVRSLTRPLRCEGLRACLAGIAVGMAAGPSEAGGVVAFAPPPKPASAKRMKWKPVSPEAALAANAMILIAEDNPTNQIVMKNLMGRLGFSIDVAGNGVEAIEMIAKKPYGLLITDCHMPEMDGYELTKRLRADETASGRKRLPIVALTGDALAGAAQYCLDVGMDDYLSKPVAIDLLDQAVQRWLPAATNLRQPFDSEAPAPVVEKAAIAPPPAPAVEKPPVPVIPSAPPFMPAALRDVFGSLNEDAFDLYSRFLDHAGRSSLAIREAVDRADYAGAAIIADRSRTAAETVGAGEVAELCGELTVRLRSADPGVPALLERLPPALTRARQSADQARAAQ